jgi:hypothetical protein
VHIVRRSHALTAFVISCTAIFVARSIEDVLQRYGEDSNAHRVRVLGEFPTADDETVIPLELVESTVNRDMGQPGPYYPVRGVGQ